MRFFPRRHTFESVAAELIAGLENGTVALRPEPPSVHEAIAESLQLATDNDAVSARLVSGYSPPEALTAEVLLIVESERPGAVHEFLEKMRDIRSELARLEAEKRWISRVRLAARIGPIALAVGAAAYLGYLCVTDRTAAIAAVIGSLFGGLAFAAFSFRSKLIAPAQGLADVRAKLLSAVNDLSAQARSLS